MFISMLGFGIVVPLLPIYANKLGATGLFSLVLVSLGFIWAQNTLQLIIVRCLQGIATTMHLPVAQAYLGEITPEGEEGRWMGHFNAILFSGMGVGPLLVVY